MNKIQRCAIYIRVSTAEQAIHGKSLEAQLDYLSNYAREHEMHIVDVFADEGKTARKNFRNRKAIKSLLEHVKNDEIDVILFWKMDRWFRNVSDFYKVQDILDAHNTKWIAAAEPNISMDTREGRLNLNLVLAIGQNETDTTSERIKFVNEASVNQGKLIFGKDSMPFGYTSAVINGAKKMVIDDTKKDIVNEVFRYFLQCQSKRGTVSYIKENYCPEFTYAVLQKMLSNPLYTGSYKTNPSYCPAYLDTETWSKVQELSQRNIKKTPSKNIYLFTGLIKCPICGHSYTGVYSARTLCKNTNDKRTYIYYRCSYGSLNKLHKIKPINELKIEQYLLDNLDNELKSLIIKCVSIKNNDNCPLKPNPGKTKREIERLNYLFQKGRIDPDKYEKEFDSLNIKLRNIELELAKENSELSTDHDYLKSLLESDWKSIYSIYTRESKRSFWRNIIKEIVIDGQNNISSIIFF